jgi:hypothetical protein
MKPKVNKFPGLYRETGGSGASRFRIVINHNSEIIQEYFYFGANRTEKEAEKAAKKRWREIRKKIPVMTKRRFREVLRKPTASGIPGVIRITANSRDHEYDVWKANWTSRSGARRSRQFSINKYGEKKAKRLAIQTRQEELDKIGVASP